MKAAGVACIVIAALMLCAGESRAQNEMRAPQDARDEASFTRHIDVRQAQDDPDHLGIDFDVRLEKYRGSTRDIRSNYGFVALAKGFQTFDRDLPDANSMVGEVSLQGTYFAVDLTQLSPAERKRHAELADKMPSADPPGPGLTDEEQKEYDALEAKVVGHRPTLWTYDLHYRIETNHDASKTQNVFGAGGAFEIPLLASLLDVVPSVLRGPGWLPQPVRAYLGVDFVRPEQDSVLSFAAGSVDQLWRLRLESAWRTRIMSGVDLRAEARMDWLPDPPDAIADAGRGVNAFVQAWLLYPLGSDRNTGVMVTYLDGRLPPTYATTSAGKVGLTIGLSGPQ